MYFDDVLCKIGYKMLCDNENYKNKMKTKILGGQNIKPKVSKQKYSEFIHNVYCYSILKMYKVY